MNIIIPRTQSRKVESWLQVKDQVLRTIKFMRNYRGPTGRRHLALHHSQVSQTPFDFFVVPSDPDDASKPYMVVMNAKIVSKQDPFMNEEACMSFPFRQAKKVKRYAKIEVDFDEFSERDGIVHNRKEMTGLMALIFQHEIQHATGNHIYS